MADDLNLLYGTVTDGGSTLWTVNDPGSANDGSEATNAFHSAAVKLAGTYHLYLASDLGIARTVEQAVWWAYAYSHAWDALEYTTDGANWFDSGATPNQVLYVWTATLPVPITARYWRLRYSRTLAGADYIPPTYVTTWQLFGTTPPPPPAGVYVDWEGDGFGDELSIDCITGYVASWRIDRGAGAELIGGAEPGKAVIILNNPADDRFNPRNADGPLFGLLRDGVPVWISVGADGSADGEGRIGMFGGQITDITPIPEQGADVAPTVELMATDCLGWYERVPVRLEDTLNRTQGQLRAALLAAAGETRVELPSEKASLVLSSADGSLRDELEAINAANGTRHYCRPGATPAAWYAYVAVNRQHGLDGTADYAINDAYGDPAGRAITGTDGWRLSADTVINRQRVSVVPVSFTLGAIVVWEAEDVPLRVTSSRPREFWIEFDDVVRDPVVSVNYTGTAPVMTLDASGATAHLEITSAGTTTISRLLIEGRLARRGQVESHVAEDLTSQAPPRGVRAGVEISGDLVGALAFARGLAEHIVWRAGEPTFRPTVVLEDWMPGQATVQLYDTVDVTVRQLSVAGLLMEVVGISHVSDQAPLVTTVVLQECRAQVDPGWFKVDISTLDSTDKLAY